jgi:hypothetical protein
VIKALVEKTESQKKIQPKQSEKKLELIQTKSDFLREKEAYEEQINQLKKQTIRQEREQMDMEN